MQCVSIKVPVMLLGTRFEARIASVKLVPRNLTGTYSETPCKGVILVQI
jgi:hypothetical protein